MMGQMPSLPVHVNEDHLTSLVHLYRGVRAPACDYIIIEINCGNEGCIAFSFFLMVASVGVCMYYRQAWHEVVIVVYVGRGGKGKNCINGLKRKEKKNTTSTHADCRMRYVGCAEQVARQNV